MSSQDRERNTDFQHWRVNYVPEYEMFSKTEMRHLLLFGFI